MQDREDCQVPAEVDSELRCAVDVAGGGKLELAADVHHQQAVDLKVHCWR